MKYPLIIGSAFVFLISLGKIYQHKKENKSISLWVIYSIIMLAMCLTVIFVEPKH